MKVDKSKHAFRWPVRIYYEDTDAVGVVYYANYLKYLERARSEWLRQAGLEVASLSEREKMIFVVRSVALEYLRPARLGELLDVTVTCTGSRGASVTLVQKVVREHQCLVSADVKLAILNSITFKPRRIPQSLQAEINRWKMS